MKSMKFLFVPGSLLYMGYALLFYPFFSLVRHVFLARPRMLKTPLDHQVEFEVHLTACPVKQVCFRRDKER